MSKREKITKEISDSLPKGVELPDSFEFLFDLKEPAIFGLSNIEDFQLEPSSKKEMIPFSSLDDGSVLAFWHFESELAIVYLGSEGELTVIADKFDLFLQLINIKNTGLSDFDDSDVKYNFPIFNPNTNFERKDYLNKEILVWYKKHTVLLEPNTSSFAENTRINIMNISHSILDDGLCKVYTKDSVWWNLSFKIEIDTDSIILKYLDYGKWYILPEKYNLKNEVRKLLLLVKNKNKKEYDLSVSSPGIVSINNDTELVLTE